MKVAFDGAPLDDGPALGVARAFVDGLAAYARVATTPPVLLLPAGATDPGLARVVVVAAPRGALRRQLALPRLLRSLRCDVLHSPVAAVPLLTRCPRVCTVHDLPWLCRDAGERTPWWRRRRVRASLAAADAVLAPSTFTLTLVRGLVDPRRTHLVPHGVPAPAAPAADAPRRGPLLALGADRPRKNRARVARAVDLARRRDARVPPIRFVGPPDDFVTEAHKGELLAACTAVVHGSLFEGFGLPVLEGLAHGAPVLCSDLPPHREIAADAALFVDPRDEDAIAGAVVRIATDADLRARLGAMGPARAREFTPERTAAHWQRIHAEIAR